MSVFYTCCLNTPLYGIFFTWLNSSHLIIVFFVVVLYGWLLFSVFYCSILVQGPVVQHLETYNFLSSYFHKFEIDHAS